MGSAPAPTPAQQLAQAGNPCSFFKCFFFFRSHLANAREITGLSINILLPGKAREQPKRNLAVQTRNVQKRTWKCVLAFTNSLHSKDGGEECVSGIMIPDQKTKEVFGHPGGDPDTP